MSFRQRQPLFWVVVWPLAVCCFLALFWRAIFLGETFFDVDLASYYRPTRSLIVALARASGGIPLWNPFFASGQPFAGNPAYEVFHPLTTLFFLLPFEWAFRLQIIVPLLVGSAGMYWFLRTLRRSRPASVLGSLSWSCGGYLLSTTCQLAFLHAASVIPFALGLAVRLARKPRIANAVGLALVIGTQCLTGEPSTLLMMPLLVSAAVLAERRRLTCRALRSLAASLLLGLALGAVTLIPGLHHAGKTVRALGLPEATASLWSMPAWRAFELFTPYLLGHVVPGQPGLFWGGFFYDPRVLPYYHSLYPGLLITLLAIFALVARGRVLWPWIAIALLGFVMALGHNFVVWPLLRRLPLVAEIRFPEKFSLLFCFPLVTLAAYGFDYAVLGPARARLWMKRALLKFVVLGLLAACAVWLARERLPSHFPKGQTLRDCLRVSLVALVSLLPLWLASRLGRVRRALAVCAVLAADLVAVGRGLVPTTTVASVTAPPDFLMPLLQRREDDVIFHMAAWASEFDVSSGLARPPIPVEWGLAMTYERDFDLTQLRWTTEATTAFWRAFEADPGLAAPVLARRGVTAVVQVRPGASAQEANVRSPSGAYTIETKTTRNPQPLAFPIRRIRVVDGAEDWLRAVRELGSEIPEVALVDGGQSLALPEQPSPARVRVVARTPVRFALEVEAAGPAASFIAVNQTWDPGWRARVDGSLAPLVRTDISLSGVLVPPGQHRVEFEYFDHALAAGLAVSVAAALACLVMMLLARRRRFGPARLSTLKRVDSSSL
ncbi:MAG TPA: hypothetical protein VJ860_20795 [Polyangia bacterium]|nr:hypothetical protein [Polyangia bacterium]